MAMFVSVVKDIVDGDGSRRGRLMVGFGSGLH